MTNILWMNFFQVLPYSNFLSIINIQICCLQYLSWKNYELNNYLERMIERERKKQIQNATNKYRNTPESSNDLQQFLDYFDKYIL